MQIQGQHAKRSVEDAARAGGWVVAHLSPHDMHKFLCDHTTMDQTKFPLDVLLAAYPPKVDGTCSWGLCVVFRPGNNGFVIANCSCSATSLRNNGPWQQCGAWGKDHITYKTQWDFALNVFRALMYGPGTTFIERFGSCNDENHTEYLKLVQSVAGEKPFLMSNQRGGATTKTNVKAAKEKNPEEFAEEVAKVIMLKSEGLSTASCSGAARSVAGGVKGGATTRDNVRAAMKKNPEELANEVAKAVRLDKEGSSTASFSGAARAVAGWAKGGAMAQANARAAATANAAIWANMSSDERSAAMESMRAQLVEDKQVWGARCLKRREKVAWDHMTPEEKRACQLSIASEIKRRRV